MWRPLPLGEEKRMLQEGTEEKTAFRDSARYRTTQMKKELVLQRLKESGCRITRQREILLDIILQEECSCCKEIYYKAAQKDKNIGFATVYRMVNMLETIGAISRRNLYKIVCAEEHQEHVCSVELSDHSICDLSSDVLSLVMEAGLQTWGYITDQKIENIIVWPCECRKNKRIEQTAE